ncbi:hypothetical protein [Gemmobacter aquaticus]|jgi:hypothetical protein|uniref:hypothetical protein n=1 Tax=Gemmobacter aquaticus TaxID=490185 RepID=UPI0011B5222D|nr:hypothetical protein [Gemmobacter aquaticus]
MTPIPEYHFLLTKPPSGKGLKVSVLIDGDVGKMPAGEMEPATLDRLVRAHAAGRLPFMSFAEHPLRLLDIVVTGSPRRAQIQARALQPKDAFPGTWEPAGIEAV